MKIVDIQNNQSNSLILFFNGWGFDEASVKHLQTKNFDVKIVYDYRTIEPITTNLIENYQTVIVIAWSYGVWGANATLQNVESQITKLYAINGTLAPVDDNFGIPTKIFNITINSLSETSYPKFTERIMGQNNNLKSAFLPKRVFEEQLQELNCLAEYFKTSNKQLNWTKAICSKIDKIFPFENQKHFWKKKSIEKLYPHFVFDKYKTWDELLNEFTNV